MRTRARSWRECNRADRHVKQIPPEELTAVHVAEAARRGDNLAHFVMEEARVALAQAILQVIVLLCPRRIVIGGGVSLLGEDLFFAPLRRYVAEDVTHRMTASWRLLFTVLAGAIATWLLGLSIPTLGTAVLQPLWSATPWP